MTLSFMTSNTDHSHVLHDYAAVISGLRDATEQNHGDPENG